MATKRIWNLLSVPLSCFIVIVLLELVASPMVPFWERLAEVRFSKLRQYEQILETPADRIVLVGSSTVNMGVNPDFLQAETGIESFNAGQLQYADPNLAAEIVSELISKKSASVIVYAFDSWSLAVVPRDRSLADSHGRTDHFLWHSAAYRNQEVISYWAKSNLRGKWMNPLHAWHEHLVGAGRLAYCNGWIIHPNGYVAVDAGLNPTWQGYMRPAVPPFNKAAKQGLDRILKMCQESGTPLVLLRMPEFEITYRENSSHEGVRRYVRDLCAPLDIPILDYTLPGTFDHTNEELYWDTHHLNGKGAEILSKQFARDLARVLRSKENSSKERWPRRKVAVEDGGSGLTRFEAVGVSAKSKPTSHDKE